MPLSFFYPSLFPSESTLAARSLLYFQVLTFTLASFFFALNNKYFLFGISNSLSSTNYHGFLFFSASLSSLFSFVVLLKAEKSLSRSLSVLGSSSGTTCRLYRSGPASCEDIKDLFQAYTKNTQLLVKMNYDTDTNKNT